MSLHNAENFLDLVELRAVRRQEPVLVMKILPDVLHMSFVVDSAIVKHETDARVFSAIARHARLAYIVNGWFKTFI
jgi:hypothetical protein